MEKKKAYYLANEFKAPWERKMVRKARGLDKVFENSAKILKNMKK